jgi:hypothetical protein
MVVGTMGPGTSGGNRTISSISIGGTNGTIATDNTAVNGCAGIAYRAVTAGAQNVTITFSGNVSRCTCAVWLITGVTDTPADTDRGYVFASATSFGITLDFPSGGGIAVYVGTTNASTTDMTWPAASTDYENNPEAGRAEYAHKELLVVSAGDVETVACGSSTRAWAGAVWA